MRECRYVYSIYPFLFMSIGIWKCYDGSEEVAYRNWLTNPRWPHPDNSGGNEDCVEMNVADKGQWNDLQCSEQINAICKAAFSQHFNCII